MLSATPHDGRRESFASLMTMLNPTAIVDPENYGPDDIKGLFIRRFKKDVKAQIRGALPERVIKTIETAAAPEEENAYDILTSIHFKSIDKRRSEGAMLFRTTLEKSLFSSPVACIETINHRIQTLKSNAANNGDNAQSLLSDVAQLESLRQAVEQITLQANAKYQRLLKLLKPNGELKWNRKDSSDRVVIFTERRATLKFLQENLERDLKLKPEEVAILHGEMADTEIQEKVEQFGNETSKIRLLICSDVASEGLNLHYFSHRLIHYDIPWSLMVFQQRNGRIDRYGQTRTPEIYYLQTTSQNKKIRGDNRILELLTHKDQEVQNSIGDPSEFTHRYDSESEERQTAQAMEDGLSDAAFSKQLAQEDDPLALLLSSVASPISIHKQNCTAEAAAFYSSDYWYAKDALHFLSSQQNIQWEFHDDAHRIVLTPTAQMKYRLKFLPPEILPVSFCFNLIFLFSSICSKIDFFPSFFNSCKALFFSSIFFSSFKRSISTIKSIFSSFFLNNFSNSFLSFNCLSLTVDILAYKHILSIALTASSSSFTPGYLSIFFLFSDSIASNSFFL